MGTRKVEISEHVFETAERRRFSLNDYEMQRDPDENDENYELRLRLFR